MINRHSFINQLTAPAPCLMLLNKYVFAGIINRHIAITSVKSLQNINVIQ